jgi:hypothetical protein
MDRKNLYTRLNIIEEILYKKITNCRAVIKLKKIQSVYSQPDVSIQGVTERSRQILGTISTYKNPKNSPSQQEAGNIQLVRYI